MARPIRVEFSGAVYHVTARANERRLTFRDDVDRRQFLALLERAVQEHGLRVHGYCLMPNHYHLLVETPRANLSRSIGWLQTTYTIGFNRRHRRSGHLFHGRFKAHLVEADSYAMEVLRHLHLSPVRPRDKGAPVPAERRSALAQYPWSSHRAYLGRQAAPAWLCKDWLLFFGRRHAEAQREYQRFMGQALGRTVESPWDQLKGGLALGGEAFVKRVWERTAKKSGKEKVRWVNRAENPRRRMITARGLASRQEQRCWQVWVRVGLGGERRIDVARDYGYSDGSAITQILKRLHASTDTDKLSKARMKALQTEFERNLSRVKS